MSSLDYGALGAMQGPPPGPLDQQGQPGSDPLGALQDAIHSVTAAMVALPDPRDTQDAAQALRILAGVQTRLMSGANAAPQG